MQFEFLPYMSYLAQCHLHSHVVFINLLLYSDKGAASSKHIFIMGFLEDM